MPKSKLKSTPSTTPESPRKTPRTTPATTPQKIDPAGDDFRLGRRSPRGQGSVSPSPVRKPKPKFDLDEATDKISAAKLEKIDNDKNGPIFENKIKLKKERTKEKKHLVDSVVDNAVDTTLKKDSKKIEKTEKSKNSKKSKSKSPVNEQNDKENLKTAETDDEKTIKSTKKVTKKKDDKTKAKPKKEPKNEPKKEVKDEPSDDRSKEEIPIEKFKNEVMVKPQSPHRIVYKKEKKPKAPNTKAAQARKSKKKIAQDDDQTYNGGARITDFFEIRRSSRKPAKQIEEEQRALWKQYLKEERIDGLEIQKVPLKGRGIFSTRSFHKGEFVVEYAGDLITPKEAEVRDEKYSKNTDKYGSYMYYFVHKGTKWCIDATIESGKYGRLLNHSCKTPNCATKILEVDGLPRLIIYAKQDIASGTELIYDYGDKGKLSLQAHPWLAL